MKTSLENPLLYVTVTPEAKAKMLVLLAKEDPDEVFFRILEVKIGSGWTGSCELRVSIDEPDEDYEELKGEAEGMPFIIRSSLVGTYGRHFHVFMDSFGLLCVSPRGIPNFRMADSKRRESFSWWPAHKKAILLLAPNTLKKAMP